MPREETYLRERSMEPMVYFVPNPEAVIVHIVLNGEVTRIVWPRKMALNKLADLANFITEIKDGNTD